VPHRIPHRRPDPPVGRGQPRAGFCRGGARERDPWSPRRNLDSAGRGHGDFPACGVFAAGHWPDRVAIDRAVQRAEMGRRRLPAVHRLQGVACATGQADGGQPAQRGRRTYRPWRFHLGLRHQRTEPQGDAVFPVAVHRGHQPSYPPGNPGRLRRLPGGGDGSVVLSGGHAVQPTASARRVRPHGPLVRPDHGRGTRCHWRQIGVYRDAL
ncbi:Threonine efflux protein, partial [Pseudomonas sp. FG-3G]